jgi:hypothetical protein
LVVFGATKVSPTVLSRHQISRGSPSNSAAVASAPVRPMPSRRIRSSFQSHHCKQDRGNARVRVYDQLLSLRLRRREVLTATDAHKKDLFIAMLIGNEKTPTTWVGRHRPEDLRDPSRALERVTLKLGGKSPNIVFEDARLENAGGRAPLESWLAVCDNLGRQRVICPIVGTPRYACRRPSRSIVVRAASRTRRVP